MLLDLFWATLYRDLREAGRLGAVCRAATCIARDPRHAVELALEGKL